MATIFNTVERVGGSDQPRFAVSVELIWDKELSPVAKLDAEDRLIHGPYSTYADFDGYWEIENVHPNINILPANSVYKVTETFGDSSAQTTQVYYISVPDGATPTYWVGDCLTGEPDYA